MTFDKSDGKAILTLLVLVAIVLISGFFLLKLIFWLFSFDLFVVFFIFAVIITALALLEVA